VISRPLPNRVDPFGALFATPERGSFFGNRGGRFHEMGSATIPRRPYASRQWICCRLSFKGRRRQVWGQGYTELFFTDEVTALSAGHRPCFECRREEAMAFAAAWGRAQGTSAPRAPEMDVVLHEERLVDGRSYGKRQHLLASRDLPDGAMVIVDARPYAVRSALLHPWTFAGFLPAERELPQGQIVALTPPSILRVLAAGYRPTWSMAEPLLAGADAG
jgi:hypothetical protein